MMFSSSSKVSLRLALLLAAGLATNAVAQELTEREHSDLRLLATSYRDAYREIGREKGAGWGPAKNVAKTALAATEAIPEGWEAYADASVSGENGKWVGPVDGTRIVGEGASAWADGVLSRVGSADRDQWRWGGCVEHQELALEALRRVPQQSWKIEALGTKGHNWAEAVNERTRTRFTFDGWHYQRAEITEGSQYHTWTRFLPVVKNAAWRKNQLSELAYEGEWGEYVEDEAPPEDLAFDALPDEATGLYGF